MGYISLKKVKNILRMKILYLVVQIVDQKIIKPDITIDKVTELDENQIKELKQKYQNCLVHLH